MMDGRTFDELVVRASFSNELDFGRAQLGEWITSAPAIQQLGSMGMPGGSIGLPSPAAAAAAGGMLVMGLPGPPAPPGMTTIPGLPPGTFIPVLQPPPTMTFPGMPGYPGF